MRLRFRTKEQEDFDSIARGWAFADQYGLRKRMPLLREAVKHLAPDDERHARLKQIEAVLK